MVYVYVRLGGKKRDGCNSLATQSTSFGRTGILSRVT